MLCAYFAVCNTLCCAFVAAIRPSRSVVPSDIEKPLHAQGRVGRTVDIQKTLHRGIVHVAFIEKLGEPQEKVIVLTVF